MYARNASTQSMDRDPVTTINDFLRMHVVVSRPTGWIDFQKLHEMICEFATLAHSEPPSRQELERVLDIQGFRVEVFGERILVHGLSPADPRC